MSKICKKWGRDTNIFYIYSINKTEYENKNYKRHTEFN